MAKILLTQIVITLFATNLFAESAFKDLLRLNGEQAIPVALSPIAKEVRDTSQVPQFKYHADSGKCLDAQGKEGLNPLDEKNIFGPADVIERFENGSIRKVVFQDRNGECTDFSGVDFSKFLRKREYGWGYLNLENWKLDGSKFTGARIFFYVGKLSLKGADMRGVQVGYIMFHVTFDRFGQGLENCDPKDEKGNPSPDGTCYWRF